MLLSIGQQPDQQTKQQSLLQRNVDKFLRLFRMRAMRRFTHILLPFKFEGREILRRFDWKLHVWMGEPDGGLKITYYSDTLDGPVSARSLEEFARDPKLPEVLDNLQIKFEDRQLSIELIFSPERVESRVIGGANDEEREKIIQKHISKFLRKRKAKYLVPMLAIFLCLPIFFFVPNIAELAGAKHNIVLLLHALVVVFDFSMVAVVMLHNKGIYFSHTQIVLSGADSVQHETSISQVLAILSGLASIAGLIKSLWSLFFVRPVAL